MLFLQQSETEASLSRKTISLYLCCYFKTFCLGKFSQNRESGYNSQNMIGSNQKIDGLFVLFFNRIVKSFLNHIIIRESMTRAKLISNSSCADPDPVLLVIFKHSIQAYHAALKI